MHSNKLLTFYVCILCWFQPPGKTYIDIKTATANKSKVILDEYEFPGGVGETELLKLCREFFVFYKKVWKVQRDEIREMRDKKIKMLTTRMFKGCDVVKTLLL